MVFSVLLPGHAAVDGKVEGVGEADDDVDEEDDVVHQLVVKELHKAAQKLFYLRLKIPMCSFWCSVLSMLKLSQVAPKIS